MTLIDECMCGGCDKIYRGCVVGKAIVYDLQSVGDFIDSYDRDTINDSELIGYVLGEITELLAVRDKMGCRVEPKIGDDVIIRSLDDTAICIVTEVLPGAVVVKERSGFGTYTKTLVLKS